MDLIIRNNCPGHFRLDYKEAPACHLVFSFVCRCTYCITAVARHPGREWFRYYYRYFWCICCCMEIRKKRTENKGTMELPNFFNAARLMNVKRILPIILSPLFLATQSMSLSANKIN